MAYEFSGRKDNVPQGYKAWFDWPPDNPRSSNIVFGHWSALGFYRGRGVVCTDSGCVWGRKLTAYRLEDGAVFTQASLE